MYACRARFDHCLHQFVRIENTTEPGLGVGDNRLHPIYRIVTLCVVQLVCAQQRVIDAAYHVWH